MDWKYYLLGVYIDLDLRLPAWTNTRTDGYYQMRYLPAIMVGIEGKYMVLLAHVTTRSINTIMSSKS